MATAQSTVMVAVCILLITELILARKDYYDILGIPRDATERQIKKAFHKLAMKLHPDKNKSPDAEAKFREIAEAYETLSDEKRRQEYDQMGHSPFFNEDATAGGGGAGRGGGAGGQHFQTFDFDDMFRDFDFYAQNRHAQHRRHFEEHLRTQQQAHQQAHARHKRHFQGGFGAGLFDDVFDDMEKMFTFERDSKRAESRFQGTAKQQCRTVTQRRGNMVTTYTDCTGS
ncbi:hypothetical protein ACEWY4_010918 [Coilia grayii]|uniref:DnaJ homolog subfamily B member 9 n=1 Tax=Coilia grayii TaxID=363190 RepID=A0ABD1K3A2_9TELE